MFLPLNSGSTNDWPSKKSLPQPRFGQIATAAFGTPQNFDSIVGCWTWRYWRLKPSDCSWLWIASTVLDAGAWLSPHTRTLPPWSLPDGHPTFFVWDSSTSLSPWGVLLSANTSP